MGLGREDGGLFLQLCGDGPSATDFKSQAAWAGGWAKRWERAEDSGWAGGCGSPFPPLRILSRA